MSEQITLFIKPVSAEIAALYRERAAAYNATEPAARDTGFDLLCCRGDITMDYPRDTVLIGQGCHAVAVDGLGRFRAFWLAPRSSISKTPWRLANSMGLIDATYRGVIKAALTPLILPADHQRLCQLARADLLPWSEVVVLGTADELPGGATARGAGGFGSTGAAC